MKQEILDQLKELVSKEFTKELISEGKTLVNNYRDLRDKEEREQLEAFLADEENDRNDFMPTKDELEDQFDAVNLQFIEKKKAFTEARAAEERKNLAAKKDIIDKINFIVQNEENIGKAFNAFNELREEWQKIGRVPGDKHADVTSAFHVAVDSFYYNINIYKDLQDLDLQKNLTAKKEILAKLKELQTAENNKELEQNLKDLHKEWFDLGPVPREEFEPMKEEFNGLCDTLFAKVKEQYQKRKEEQQANLQLKQGVVDKVKNVDTSKINSHKGWQKATEKIIALQEEWKTIGFGPKKENEELWNDLRAHCDAFFDKKKVYYDGLHKDYDVNKAQKEDLCERAEALSENQNWKDTADKIKALQNKWKNVGPAGPKFEQKLWLRFRAACNAFFDNKKAHFEKKDEEFAGNYTAKIEMIEKIKSTELGDNKEENVKLIKSLIADFNAIGFVPRNKMDEVNKQYQDVIDAKFEACGIDKEELENSKFVTRVQSMLNAENYDFQIQKERRFLDGKIKEFQDTVIQYENNLGFFSNAKGNNPMVKDVMNKIAKAKQAIEKIQEQKKIMSKMKKKFEQEQQAATEPKAEEAPATEESAE